MLVDRVLRPGLLDGISLLVAGAMEPAAALGNAVDEVCTELGADVYMCAPVVADEALVDQMVIDAVTELGSLDLLVVDAAGLFAQGGLRACLDAAWNVTRAVVNHAFLLAPEPSSPSGRVIYLAPAPTDAQRHSGAARAGLENLARTLSTEWARHGITVVTIASGEATIAGEVAALCAYLASPAGAYVSGCLLDLRGPDCRQMTSISHSEPALGDERAPPEPAT